MYLHVFQSWNKAFCLILKVSKIKKYQKNKTDFAFLTTHTSCNKIKYYINLHDASVDVYFYLFSPCWGSNKGNIQIIIIRDVVPWLACYWCTFQ